MADSTGGVLPNVRVTLTNERTNETRPATTDQAGVYSFAQVAPGSYRVEAEAQGLLTSSMLEALLRAEVQRRRVVHLFEAADRLGLAMIFTGVRHFRH